MNAPGHAVVVGAGIAGLAAARLLAEAGVRVTVLEGAAQVGGKLRVSEIAGIAVDEGAESMLARRPEGLELARALGQELVHPGTTTAAIYSRGRLHKMPQGQVMGVPTDLKALADSGIMSLPGLARVSFDLVNRPTPFGGDVSVADFVGARVGGEVVDRLVEPLLGGVYAGRTDELSFEATLPAIAAAARTHRSLIAAAKHVKDSAPANPGPVFASIPGGLGGLPGVLVDAITEAGGTVRTGAMVRELRRTPVGWRLTVGPAREPESIEADAVIVAVPAGPAAKLLAEEVPAAARELDRIDYASMAIVTLAYNATAFPKLPRGSGYLVPAVEGRQVKAVTFSTVKWPHLNKGRQDTVVVRCSIGRFRDEHLLQRSDEDLRAVAIAEMADVCHAGELPVETRVSRWGGGLPQYNVGHADLVARARGAVARQPGLALAGAAYDGLGIPACIATARSAATRILEHLRSGGESEHVSDGATSDRAAEAESAGPEQGDPLHDVVGLQGEESG